MSIPKEPRQLMINLMYLVLIALLALNVSAEILNAFTLVNKGIGNTNSILADKNSQIVDGIKDKASQQAGNPRTQDVYADAQSVQKITANFVNYVDSLKTELIHYTGDTVMQKGYPHLKGEGDTEKPTTMFINKGNAAILKARIESVRKDYVSLLQKWNGGDKVSQLTLSVDTTEANAKKLTWEEYNFYKVPAIAAVTILTKIQNDAKSAESTVLEHLGSQVDAIKFKVDQMTAKVIAPTSYVMKGKEYTADIFVAATSKTEQPEVYLGSFTSAVKKDENEDYVVVKGSDKDMPLTGARKIEVTGGMGRIKEAASGSPKYQGVIKLPDPAQPGNFQYFPFDFGYETFEVGGAVVSPTAMNVLYIGVDNPIKISVPGYTSDKVNASGCGISHNKGEEYISRPTAVGLDKIVVSVKQDEGTKTYENEFRVKRIPDPYAYCGSSKGGTMKIGEFKITSKLDAKNTDFVFQIPYNVTGFEMIYAPKTGTLVSDVSKSNTFTNTMEQIKQKAKPGDSVFFPSINVRMPDGTTRQITLAFKLIG